MNSPAIRIVSPHQFDIGTAQTPGSERRAAIAPSLGIASAIWGGMFEVEPGSRTGVHHHGEQDTIAYVLSGICCGAGASVANAIYNACGVRIRDYPITLDKLIAQMPVQA